MKNEKIVKVCEVVIQVCNIAVIIAQAVKSAFPAMKAANQVSEIDQEEAELIKQFMESKLK